MRRSCWVQQINSPITAAGIATLEALCYAELKGSRRRELGAVIVNNPAIFGPSAVAVCSPPAWAGAFLSGRPIGLLARIPGVILVEFSNRQSRVCYRRLQEMQGLVSDHRE